MNAEKEKMRILFVDDEPKILKGLQRMLRSIRHEWDMLFVESGPEALKILEHQPCDVIVSDMRMPGMNGVELLEEVKKRYTSTVRIILSGHSDSMMTLRAVQVAHQYIAKPTNAQELKDKISRSQALIELLNSAPLLQVVLSMDKVPAIPAGYHQIVHELQKEEPNLKNIGQIIATDPGMSAKLLQLVNSSFFGLPRHIESPNQAVTLLGLDTVKSLVLAVEIFSCFDSQKIPSRKLSHIWQHSIQTGMVAKSIAKEEGLDKHMVDDAAMAGLLHDVGKLILMDKFSDIYKHKIRQHVTSDSLCLAEQKVFGISHAEVGSYLFDLWGLPSTIVEATGFHHCPSFFPLDDVGPLLAVHIANALTKTDFFDQGEDALINSLDTAYIQRLGLTHRYEKWMQIGRESLLGEDEEQ